MRACFCYTTASESGYSRRESFREWSRPANPLPAPATAAKQQGEAMSSVFVTGVSSGIGYALVREYLAEGWRVYGVSRRTPGGFSGQESFHHAALDLQDHGKTRSVLSELLADAGHLDLAVLNAGTLGRFDDLGDVDLGDLKQVMEINLWANKTVIDALFSGHRTIGQVVAISSGASVNGNRGWAGYSVSKAALNMLVRLYAREHLETHFCALAPGVIDTPMMDKLCSLSPDDRFAALQTLRSRRDGGEMPTPAEAAGQLVDVFARLPRLVESGDYADIRKLS